MATRLSTPGAAELAVAAAPLSGWRRMFSDSLITSAATVICHGLGVVTSLSLRMFLDPAQMGIWQALKVLLSYGNYTGLGASKGATRQLSVAVGRGQPADAQRELNLAFTFNTISSLAYGSALLAAAVWTGTTGTGPWSSVWALGLAAVAVLVVLQRYVTYQVTILRAEHDFRSTAQLSVLEGVLTLSVAGGATWFWGLPGLVGATLLVMLGSLAFLRLRGLRRLSWHWDRVGVLRLIGQGGPILLAGAVSSLLRSLDKLMILGYLSDREFQLGCYSVALLVGTQLFGLANMLSMVMGPRYAALFGSTGSRATVARLAARSSELLAAGLALSGGLAMVAAAPLLGWILPDYRPGLAPLVWVVPGAMAIGLTLPASQYLVAVYHERRVLAVLLVATVVAAGGNHWALTHRGGLVGVAAATALAYMVYFVLLIGVSLWPELDRNDRARYLLGIAWTIIPTLTLAAALESLVPTAEFDGRAIAGKMLTIAIAWSLLARIGWRLGGWSTLWRQERS